MKKTILKIAIPLVVVVGLVILYMFWVPPKIHILEYDPESNTGVLKFCGKVVPFGGTSDTLVVPGRFGWELQVAPMEGDVLVFKIFQGGEVQTMGTIV